MKICLVAAKFVIKKAFQLKAIRDVLVPTPALALAPFSAPARSAVSPPENKTESDLRSIRNMEKFSERISTTRTRAARSDRILCGCLHWFSVMGFRLLNSSRGFELSKKKSFGKTQQSLMEFRNFIQQNRTFAE